MKEKQLDMFTDICAKKHKGNPYSVAANKKVRPRKQTQRAKVLNIITNFSPISCEDIERNHGIRYTAASARISELKALGLIHQVGTTTTTSGCTAATYGV